MTCPIWHDWHVLALQTWVEGHVVAQVPQCAGSLVKSTHDAPQTDCVETEQPLTHE
jgi:hypothetical protein